MVRAQMFSFNISNKIFTWFILLFALVSFYDTLWDLLVWLLHTIAVLLHTLFEFTEHALDIVIGRIFHTDPRTTQIIVFYLMLAIGGGIILRLLIALPQWYSRLFELLVNAWRHEKETVLAYWQNKSSIEKMKSGSILMASTVIAVLWVFS